MINFFRKIRRKLADDNKPLKYMRYAIGEIVLVVIGILIALPINNWNVRKQESQLESEYLRNLIDDLSKDTTYFIETDVRFDSMVNLGENAIQSMYSKVPLKSKMDILSDYWNRSAGMLSYVLYTATYKDLESSGSLRIIKNSVLRNQIISHYKAYEESTKLYEIDLDYAQSFIAKLDNSSSLLKFDTAIKDKLYKDDALLDYTEISFF